MVALDSTTNIVSSLRIALAHGPTPAKRFAPNLLAASRTGRRIPLLKPPRADHFTNRDDDLAQLLADLQPGQVATLCGPGGIGKTALAAEAVHRQGEGNRLGNLGNAYRDLGEVEKAIECLEASLAIFVEIKSPNAQLVQQWLDELA